MVTSVFDKSLSQQRQRPSETRLYKILKNEFERFRPLQPVFDDVLSLTCRLLQDESIQKDSSKSLKQKIAVLSNGDSVYSSLSQRIVAAFLPVQLKKSEYQKSKASFVARSVLKLAMNNQGIFQADLSQYRIGLIREFKKTDQKFFSDVCKWVEHVVLGDNKVTLFCNPEKRMQETQKKLGDVLPEDVKRLVQKNLFSFKTERIKLVSKDYSPENKMEMQSILLKKMFTEIYFEMISHKVSRLKKETRKNNQSELRART